MKKAILLMLAVFLFVQITIPVLGDGLPYQGYHYDYWGEAVPAPAAYIPENSWSGADLGIGELNQASDLFVSNDRIYIADTGNNRIIVLDKDWKVEQIITEFDHDGEVDGFNAPSGIFVTDKGNLYVADRDNQRVVVLDDNQSLILELKDPQSESFAGDFQFIPEKVAVDFAGRIFVVAKGVFEGIMSFDDQGEFYGYQGTIKVSVSPMDILWRSLSTKAQREKQILFIPTEFTNFDMDQDGFIYTTNVDMHSDENIKRLNPNGNDVLRRPDHAKVDGDSFYLPQTMDYGGPSRFTDIAVRSDGIYSVLDSRRGRIFTYGHEGDLMYIFGTLGSQIGSFKKPVAIESIGDDLLVLDQERGEVVQFEATSYGQLINDAISNRYRGNERESVDLWHEVLKLNSNLELAYVGIGKSLLAAGDNREAMDYFELGMDQRYYSIAYKRYRNEFLKENLGILLTSGTVLIIAAAATKGLRRKRRPSNA